MKAARNRSVVLGVEMLEDRSVPATLTHPSNDVFIAAALLFLPSDDATLPHLSHKPTVAASAMAKNGDQNPYGVAFVPAGVPPKGLLHPGNILVSDFNNGTIPGGGNIQGTGTSIVQITQRGSTSTFFQGKSPLGLTTALGVLPGGFVIVGNLPTATGKGGTHVSGTGSLLIIDSNGHLVETIRNSQLLDGPWDLVNYNVGNASTVFVSNVLSGTVTRIHFFVPGHGKPIVQDMTQIASGYAVGTDPAALVVGPTGLAYDPFTDNLYVASTKDDEIFKIQNAGSTNNDDGTGDVIVNDPNLHGPLGLIIGPNGDLITANGDAPSVNPPPKGQQNELLEYTTQGDLVGLFRLDKGPPGAAFGVGLQQPGSKVHFAAVNDNTTQLELWTLQKV